MDPIRLALLTISDGVVAGRREDRSGDAVSAHALARGWLVVARAALADEVAPIAEVLARWADDDVADLIVTTGGTGLTARDVTPEATGRVLERQAPGIAEAIRLRGAESTPFSWISRGLAGTRGRTLIVNLPGSTGGVSDGLEVLDTLAHHAVQLLRGIDTERHEQPESHG